MSVTTPKRTFLFAKQHLFWKRTLAGEFSGSHELNARHGKLLTQTVSKAAISHRQTQCQQVYFSAVGDDEDEDEEECDDAGSGGDGDGDGNGDGDAAGEDVERVMILLCMHLFFWRRGRRILILFLFILSVSSTFQK